jgi:hypothetical protein
VQAIILILLFLPEDENANQIPTDSTTPNIPKDLDALINVDKPLSTTHHAGAIPKKTDSQQS